MQDFEPLFRRAWERGREFKLRVYILLNWVLLILLAAGVAAAAWGTYYVLIEKKRAAQSIVEVNPELRRIFSPGRKLKIKEAEISCGERQGDKLRMVVVRTPDREIRAKTADLRLDVENNTVNLTLRRYRIYGIEGGRIVRKLSEDELSALDLTYPFELPPELRQPAKPVPGEIARGLTVVATVVLFGAALWRWLWQILSAGAAREAFGERPTRMLRGWRSGFARRLTVMYPLPFLTVCGIVSSAGTLPNVLQLPQAFYVALYPAACALEITLLVFCGIMRIGAAYDPPETRFGDMLRESVRVFLNGWGRYLLGVLWVYAFLAVFAVMLVPELVLLIAALVFGSRVLLTCAVVGLAVWLLFFVVIGTRVTACITAYHMYLYADASHEEPEAGGGDNSPAAEKEEEKGK